MELSANLIQEIKRGNVVLFLGAGASMGSQDNSGNGMLGVRQLIDQLSDRFLGGEEKNSTLASVSELAMSEADIISVQIFIKQLFEHFNPAEFHLKIPLFRWKSIYTTNYDLLIEKAYAQVKEAPKKLVPIYSSTDRIDSLILSENDLPFVKLHGCINKIDEHDPPLILTTDQYVTHREKRASLFERLKTLGSSSTILFIGHSLEDSDIRQILHEVNSITTSRPRYYALILDYSEMQGRLWEGKKISLMKGTFKEFLEGLVKEISFLERSFKPSHKEHLIERFFEKSDYKLTENTLSLLDSTLQFVHSGMPSEKSKPDLFYHGYSRDWSPIQEDLDIARTISDEIISQVMLCDESERNTSTEVFLLSGSAGSGKSIALRRIAWDSAIDYNKVCLFWNSNEKINYNAILEISEKVGERIFLFVDKVVSHVPDLLLLVTKLREAKANVTIIVAERNNEWNTECGAIHKFLTDSFEVKYLGKREVNDLIDKLEKYNCLGVLKGRPREEQNKAFHETAGRQLLVALHEATSAKSFSEIIQDEYDNIVPQKAQLIYRTVCIMNRLNVPVRAGIISRVHGVSFEEFNKSFFLPLENVVSVAAYNAAFDSAYEARHPLIAEMVYTHSLKHEIDRYDNLITLMSALDIGYSADRIAFREFIKYRSLSTIFSDLNRIEKIYEKAFSICGDDDYLYQQKAIFYMRSALHNYNAAEELLFLAQKHGPYNSTIKHSLAELELIRASKSSGLERERHYNKANTLASFYTGAQSTSSHGYDTILKVAISRLEDAISNEDEELITESTRKAEQSLREALQKYPDDEMLLSDEVKLAKLLSDSDRAFKALKKSFALNNSNSYLAASLSNIYLKKGMINEAKEVLSKVLDSSPADKLVHAKLGMLLIEHFPNDGEGAEHHLRRSFTEGDANHINQLWYARQLYINNAYDDYLLLIRNLRKVAMSPDSKHKVRGIVKDHKGNHVNLVGIVVKLEHTYALLESSGYKGAHFLHRSNSDTNKFKSLKVGSDVCYNLGFTFSGAAAILTNDSI